MESDRKFREGQEVFIETESIQGYGTVVGYGISDGWYRVTLDTRPDRDYLVHEREIVDATPQEPDPPLPPFGMSREELEEYAAVLAMRVAARVSELDTSGGGLQTMECAGISDILAATLEEIEQAIVGCAISHLRVSRALVAAKSLFGRLPGKGE